MIKVCLTSPLRLFEYLYNYSMLKINKAKCASMPEMYGRAYIRNYGQLIIGNNVKISSNFRGNPIGNRITSIYVFPGAEISIGDNTGISNSCICSKKKINIGNNVMIGAGVSIFDTDFHSMNIDERMLLHNDTGIKSKEIVLCDGAFIGANSILLKGVMVGRNSVIGAGSVVTGIVPEGQVWAGNPAKFIKAL